MKTCYELVDRPSYRSTGNNFHEVEWLVGPIPEDGSGTEVVMSYGPKQGIPGKEFGTAFPFCFAYTLGLLALSL